jgi:phage-related protein (TIGR01555 family)
MNKITTMRNDAIFRRENSPQNDPLAECIYSLTEISLANLYDNYWLPRRIVDLPVDLAMKDGFVEKKADSPSVEGGGEKPGAPGTESAIKPEAELEDAGPPVVVAVKPGVGPEAPKSPKAVTPGGDPGLPEPPKPVKPEDDEIYQLFLEWNFRDTPDGIFNRGAKFGRLNGGSCVILGFKENPEVPLEEGTWPELAWLDVCTRWELTPKEFDEDANSPRYKLPTIWELGAGHSRGPLLIHHTKLIFFPGLSRARRSLDQYDKFWTLSVLQPILNSLFAYDDALIGVSQGLARFDVGVLESAGLFEALHLLNRAEIDARQEIFNDGIRNNRTIFLDPGKQEKWTRTPLAFTGLPETIEIVKADVAGGAGYPQTLIFGKSPDGMNATGESDQAIVDDVVKAYKVNVLTPALNKYMSAISGRDVEVSFDLKAAGTGPTDPEKPGESPTQKPKPAAPFGK